MVFRLNRKLDTMYDEFAVSQLLRDYGWVVPAYAMVPHCHLTVMRIVVRGDFSKGRCDKLIDDIKQVLKVLDNNDKRY